MSYVWTRSLETGDRSIDEEHRSMFRQINQLLDACARGKGQEEIGSTLEFLENYITGHFEREEKLMLNLGYNRYPEHARQHEEFRRTIHAITTEYNENGASIQLVAKLDSVVTSWLIRHIQQEDAKVVARLYGGEKER